MLARAINFRDDLAAMMHDWEQFLLCLGGNEYLFEGGSCSQ